MECWTCREAASARLDSEDPGVDPARIEEHLAGCTDCRDWLAKAVRVSRVSRLHRVEEVPDLSASVLAQVGQQHRRSHPGAGILARVALAAVAAGQWAAGLAVVFDQPVGASLPVHGAHEMGAFNLAVAVAFAWTAWRPRWARAQLPLLGTLVGIMAALTVRDVVAGHATVAAEAGHLLLAAGLALTAVLARRYAPPAPLPAAGAGSSTAQGADLPKRRSARLWRRRVVRSAVRARSAEARARGGREAA